MGDKNVVLESGTLYFGNVRFGEFKCDECEFNERKFSDDEVYLKIPSSQEATFTLKPFPKKDVQLSYEKKET